MVGNLRKVDEDLAQRIANALGLVELPDRSEPASAPITGLEPSVALSIMANGPESFEGRKVGALVDDGVADRLDDGCISLADSGSAERFVEQCRALRFWDREALVLQP